MTRIFLLVSALVLAPWPCVAAGVGGGLFLGGSFPLVQDDNGNGLQYGVRMPVLVTPLLMLEPYLVGSQMGSTTEDFVGAGQYTRAGLDAHGVGVNVGLAARRFIPLVGLTPYAGVGAYRLSRTGTSRETHAGCNLGLRLGLPTPLAFDYNIGTDFNMIVTGSTSRKFLNVYAGLTYWFHKAP